MTQENSNENGSLRESLLADIESAEQKIEAFNAHIFNHKHIFPGAAVATLILLYLGMIEPRVIIYTWSMIAILIICLVGITFWKRREAEFLNEQLEATKLAFKEYEKGRRKKKRKK